ncbi:MAG: LysM peptidoglycan-binding domain-containing protein [Trebonia sp.]
MASVSAPGAQTHAQAAAHTPAAQAAAILLSATNLAARRVPAARQAPAAKQRSATATRYTVKSGDTLSSIAQRFYKSTSYWPVLYWANHGQIHYANDINAGQVLTIPVKPAKIPAAPSALAPAPAPAPAAADASTAPAVTEQSAPAQSAPVDYAGSSTGGDSSFQQCVIQRESGGSSQVVSSGGYYGLYQFSPSTWAEYGGNPADFGNASAGEQNQVFNNAVAAGGESNWSSYDGC